MFRRPTKTFVAPKCLRCTEPLVCSNSRGYLICPKGCGGQIPAEDLWTGPLRLPAPHKAPKMSRKKFWARYHAEKIKWQKSFPNAKRVNHVRFRVFTIPDQPGFWRYSYVQPDHLQVLEPAPAAELLCGRVFAWTCNQTHQVRRFRRLTSEEEAALTKE